MVPEEHRLFIRDVCQVCLFIVLKSMYSYSDKNTSFTHTLHCNALPCKSSERSFNTSKAREDDPLLFERGSYSVWVECHCVLPYSQNTRRALK